MAAADPVGEQKFWSGGVSFPFLKKASGGAQLYWVSGIPFGFEPPAAAVASISGSVGIGSDEGFGTDGLLWLWDRTLEGVTGIVSGEVFDSSGEIILRDQLLSRTAGIVSGEVFGVGIVAGPIGSSADNGIASVEAFGEDGSLSVGTIEGEAGIESEEAFGAGGIVGWVGGPLIGLVGIPSVEAFGQGIIAGPISGSVGIESLETFGSGGMVGASLRGSLGIASEETFGSGGRLSRGASGLQGIPSQEGFGTSGAVLMLSSEHTNWGVYIAGRIVTPYLVGGSVNIDRQLNFQAGARLKLLVRDGSGYKPAVGAEIIVFYFDEESQTWSRKFGGSLESVEIRRLGGVYGAWEIDLAANDYAKVLSRRRIDMKFPAATFGTRSAIMSYISTHYLKAEGIEWVQQGDPGLAIPDLEFNYAPLNEALDRIGEITGETWQVDFYKNLRIYDRPSEITSAPFDITEETTGPNARTWRDLTVRESRGLYRNVQWVKANVAASTRIMTETYTVGQEEVMLPVQVSCNSGLIFLDNRYWNKVRRVVSMTKNGTDPLVWWAQWENSATSNPVPGDPMPALNAWDYVQIGRNELQFVWNMVGKPGAEPQAGDTITIVFEVEAELPPALRFENSEEIARRKELEGGSGIYEDVIEVSDIEDVATLTEIGQGLLAKFGVMGQEADFTCYRNGMEPGQETNVDLPGKGIDNATMIVESVSYQEDPGFRRISHTVRVSNQIQQRDAMTAFQRLIRRMRKPAARATSQINFNVARTIPGFANPGLIVGSNLANEFLLRRNFTIVEVAGFFKTPPTGASAVFNIKSNGTSIFAPGTYLTLPSGEAGIVVHREFNNAPLTLLKGSRITIDCLAAGTTEPGKDGSIVIYGYV